MHNCQAEAQQSKGKCKVDSCLTKHYKRMYGGVDVRTHVILTFALVGGE
jgi:hypothetical protein